MPHSASLTASPVVLRLTNMGHGRIGELEYNAPGRPDIVEHETVYNIVALFAALFRPISQGVTSDPG